MQPREFFLPREALANENIMRFEPNHAVSHKQVGGDADDRPLSFRFYRILVYSLPSSRAGGSEDRGSDTSE
jgi:hypothetical protein